MEFLVIIGLVVFVIWLLQSRGKQQVMTGRDAQQQQLAAARWQSIRSVAEEDVTQLGQQIAETPIPDDLDEDARKDFDDAFAAYERAKDALSTAQGPDDLQWVTRSLDDGRFSLARLQARQAGAELPSRRPPCFFDQRHGLSVADASWVPPGGAERDVPVCAACETTLADGRDPQPRMVPTADGQRPYYDAGPEYAPYARGWYAGTGLHVLNTVMLGTLLMNSLYLPVGTDYFAADATGDTGGEMGGDAGADAGGDLGGDVGGDGGGVFDDFDFGGF